ncbi:MAG: hypothetical protein PVJ84_11360, partial [Desulfobacteraceae bacterium]
FIPFTVTRVFSITQMFIFSFLGFWLLRKLVRGHPAYVIDTDWLVRIPGKHFLDFCKGPVLSFGIWLDRLIIQITKKLIVNMRNPKIEAQATPKAIGLGVFISIALFSALLVFLFGYSPD